MNTNQQSALEGMNSTTTPVLPTSKWGGVQPISPSTSTNSLNGGGSGGYAPSFNNQQQYNQSIRRSSEYNSNNWNQQSSSSNATISLNGSSKGLHSLNSSTGGTASSSSSTTSNINKTKYSKDELLNLYDPNVKIPEPLAIHTYILSEEIQPPINLNYEQKRHNRMSGGLQNSGNAIGGQNMMNRPRKDGSLGHTPGKPKWANSPSSTAQSWRSSKDHVEPVDKRIWYYLDLQNNPQGPFSSTDMDSWHSAGYFKPDLLVKRGESGFIKFKKILTTYGATAPFTSVTSHYDFQKLLKEDTEQQLQQQQQQQSSHQLATPSSLMNQPIDDLQDLNDDLTTSNTDQSDNDLMLKFRQTSLQNQSSTGSLLSSIESPTTNESILERTISPPQQQTQQQFQSQFQQQQQQAFGNSFNDQPNNSGIWEDENANLMHQQQIFSKLTNPQQQQQQQQPSSNQEGNWDQFRNPNSNFIRNFMIEQQQIQAQSMQLQSLIQQVSQQYQQLQKQPPTQTTQMQMQQLMQYLQQQQANHYILQQRFFQMQLQLQVMSRMQPNQPNQQPNQPNQPNQQPYFSQLFQQQHQQYQMQQHMDQMNQQSIQQQAELQPQLDQIVQDNSNTNSVVAVEPQQSIESSNVEPVTAKDDLVDQSTFLWGTSNTTTKKEQSPIHKSPLLSVNQEPLQEYVPEQTIQQHEQTNNNTVIEQQPQQQSQQEDINGGQTVSHANPWVSTESTVKKSKSLIEIQQEEIKEQKRKELEDAKTQTVNEKQQINAMKWGSSIPTWSVDSSPSISLKDIQQEEKYKKVNTTTTASEEPLSPSESPLKSTPTKPVSLSDVMKEQSKEKKVTSPTPVMSVQTQPKPVFNPSSPWSIGTSIPDSKSTPMSSTPTTTTTSTPSNINSNNSYQNVNNNTSKPGLSIRTDDLNSNKQTPTLQQQQEFASQTVNILPKQSNTIVKSNANSIINIKTKQQQQQQQNTPRPDFIKWCHQQLKPLTNMDVNVVTELLCSLKTENEIREFAKDCLGYAADRFIGEYLLYRSDEPGLAFESSSPVITIPIKNKPKSQTVSGKAKPGKKK
ncbi:hypothetical protein DLAC_10611 [Tieghemostelium lacteum]|uniref:GYF domain-containing protein n=1 Tax=Tieghemostelium lacteum TaxID=361077 RepID=A0A151Z4C1_TIELA|nr:hypothetical protein DLAC_10611 [Tieghemostelium lacteum]|eukprot:KYQ88812.1 hypothetical protein DLAC_10611 [Tieghemostelium lacteum]